MKPRRQGAGRAPASRRVADDIRLKIGALLQRDVRDARLLGVHVTRVEMSRDLSKASVYWRPTPGEATADDAGEALKRASGFLRARVGRTLDLRHTPELVFELDALPEEGNRIDSLLAGLSRGTGRDETDAPMARGVTDDDSEE